MKRVPQHVREDRGSAHAFRMQARALVRRLNKLTGELRYGCAFFPGGPGRVQTIQRNIEGLKYDLSAKNWGR